VDESAQKQAPLKRFISTAPYFLSRGLLNLLRSIPELVWALIFVRAVGIGPLPGMLALGIAYAGMLGKLYSEIIDSVDARPIEALQSTGASKINIVFYGYLPLALPDLISYTLYRWECGIRAAVVLGFVGAGGIGQEVELSMRMFNYHEVSTLLIMQDYRSSFTQPDLLNQNERNLLGLTTFSKSLPSLSLPSEPAAVAGRLLGSVYSSLDPCASAPKHFCTPAGQSSSAGWSLSLSEL